MFDPVPRADGDPWDAKPNPDHIYFAADNLEEYFSGPATAGDPPLVAEISDDGGRATRENLAPK